MELLDQIIEYKPVRLLRDCMRVLGYHNNFTVGKIHYRSDASSIGKTALGELTGRGVADQIRERDLKSLKVLDIACGVGIVGMTVFSELEGTKNQVERMDFTDISIFNLNSLRRTIKFNELGALLDKRLNLYLSDVLQFLPEENKYDLIISNPPDYFIEDFDSVEASSCTIGRYSPKRHFHLSFYKDAHAFLTPKGEIWFLENSDALPQEELRAIVESNPNLELRDVKGSHLNKGKYWTVVGLKG